VLPITGGEARKITGLPEGAGEIYWLPDGSGLVVVSDIKWPEPQEIDRRNGDYPTEARIWTGLLWRHWNDWRAGRRQHLFRVDLASGNAADLTPVDKDVPTIATPGDGDVAVSLDGKEIAVAVHADSNVADNTNVDIFLLSPVGGPMRDLTAANRGADNTPRFSPDGKWLAYLSMERAGFEADRLRLMLVPRAGGQTSGAPVEATAGWTLSVGSYAWCPDSRCVYAVVEEHGRDNLYRIDLPGYQRTAVVSEDGANSSVQVAPDGKTLVYLHQTGAQPPEVWASGKALTHHNDPALAQVERNPLEPYGFRGALGDSVFGWIIKPPGFDPGKRYPLVYLVHGGPQGAWDDGWSARWNYQMFAARGYVVAAVNFHGSTGYGQRFTDAISQHWGDYPLEDLMKGLDAVARLPFVDSTRMGAAGASYGGYMIYWLAGHTNRFKVLVDHDGVFNPASMYGSTEELWFPQWEFGGTPYDNRATYEKWAPLNFAQNWRTPMLIVHSQLDYRVDLSEGYQAFTALRKMGVPGKFLYFPDEGHWVLRPRNRRVWWSTVLDWLDQYLK
jgi:dipeptidyl aminopeptidase/acylaminoacyl peptidase